MRRSNNSKHQNMSGTTEEEDVDGRWMLQSWCNPSLGPTSASCLCTAVDFRCAWRMEPGGGWEAGPMDWPADKASCSTKAASQQVYMQ